MIAFVALASLLLAAVLVVLLLALRRAGQPAAIDRERLNVAIFRERRAELDAELAAGRIGAAQHAALLSELELLLVDDVVPAAATTRTGAPRVVALALLVAIPLLSLPLFVVTGFDRDVRDWLALYAQAGRVAVLPAYVDEAAAQRAGLPLRDAARLRQSQLDHHRDAQEWFGLGISWADAGIPLLAQQALRNAQRLAPERTDIAFALLYMDLQLGNGQLSDALRAEFERLLAAEPGNPRVLMLYGEVAFRNADYATAITRWEQLLALMPPGDEGAAPLRERLAEARAQQKAAAAAPAAGIRVRVALAPELGTPPPGATLFVIVRAAGGPPMPIAAKKLPAVLPAEVLLTDADQMIPGAPLRERGPLEVRARLSRAGTPMPASGDLESAPLPVSLPQREPLALVIDRRLP